MPGTSPMSMSYVPSPGPFTDVQGQRAMAGSMGVQVSGPQAIGGSTDIELMRGIAGLVRSNEAMAQELKGTATQLKVLNDRTVRMMAASVGTHTRVAQDSVTVTKKELAAAIQAGVIAVVNEASAATNAPWSIPTGPDGAPYAEAPPGPPSEGPRPGPRQPAPLTKQWAPASHGDTGREAVPEVSNWDTYQKGRGYNLGKLRQDVASNVGQRVSEAQWNPTGIQQGPWADGMFHTKTGGVASAEEIASYTRKQKILGAAKGGIGEMVGEEGSVGKGVMAMLPKGLAMGAAKLAGVVGVAKQIGDFAEGQREKNAEWQSIMGGSNAEGFKERARSRGFALSQFGTMSSSSAQELYMGVAKTGLRGGERDRATDFAVDSYKRFGMSIHDSVAMIDLAAKNGATSFGFLTQSLSGVTKAARQAGISADEMRKNFTQGLRTLTPNMGIQGAAETAAGQSIATAGYGRDLASKLDYTARNSDPTQFLIQAASQGKSANQLQADLLDPKTRGATVARQSGDLKKKAGDIMGRVGRALVANFIAQNHRHPNSEEYDRLASEYLRSPGAVNIVSVIDQISQMMGVSGMTQATAIQYLMKTFAGGVTDPSGKFATTDASVGTEQNKANFGTFAVEGGGLHGEQHTKALSQLGMPGNKVGKDDWARNLPGRTNRVEQQHAAKIYMDQANKTKRAGGVSAAMASQTGFQGDRRIRVQTKDGDRLVTTDDALRHFRDQIDAGTAMIESGADHGKTVAEAMNMAGDSNLKVTSNTESGKGKYGKAAGDSKGSNSNVKVTVEAKGELSRLLKFTNVDPNAGLGPPNARTIPNGLPSDSAKG